MKLPRLPALALPLTLMLSCGGGSGDGSATAEADLGDRVWKDLNGNGLQEPGEPGLAGLSVTLKTGKGVVATTTTDASGGYGFGGLAAGTYTLEIATPRPLVPAPVGVGSDPEIDSDLSPATVALSVGASVAATDFGFTGKSSIGDRVWIDGNCNGLQDPGEAYLDGVRVVLRDPSGIERETFTVDGLYLFAGLSTGAYEVTVDDAALAQVLTPTACNVGSDPELDSECSPVTVVLGDDLTQLTGIDFGYCPLGSSSIGDFVWHDLDFDGLQDAGEPGLSMVTVFLQDTAGTGLMQTKTDANGMYRFDGLPPGDYVIDIATPGCFAPTACDVGADDTIDSECAPVAVALAAGTGDPTLDFGFVPIGTGEIGDLVWNDVDADGLQDPGEGGLAKVKVVLLDAAGTVQGVQWTGTDGRYLFEGLCAGQYVVIVDVTATGVGFVPSPCNVGSDDTLDNDCSPACVVLPTDDSSDHTIDFGFHVPEPHEGCSHGYWKNHTSAWTSPYTASTPFADVFEDAFPGMTLLAVLQQGGGGLNALGREAVAALLNAASPGVYFPLTANDVIQRFDAVHPGIKSEYNALKDELEAENTLGCPLN